MSAMTEALEWPFFTHAHRELHARLEHWLADPASRLPQPLSPHAPQAELDAHCRDWVRALGRAGWLRHAVGGTAFGGATDALVAEATAFARQLADGPAFAHSLTKAMLHQEWSMDIDTAIEAEAQAQALCMLTEDFGHAYRAFAAKSRPVFEGR